MPCLLDIARAERFQWNADDLQELLTAGVSHHIVSGVMTMYFFVHMWIAKYFCATTPTSTQNM